MGQYGGGGGSEKLDMKAFTPVINQSTDFVVDHSTQFVREFVKKFVFTGTEPQQQ
jgi:hypothetical protein